MKNFDKLVDIWQTQKTAPEVNYEAIFAHLKKSTNQFKLKISLGLGAMVIAVLGIGFLWTIIPFLYLTTHLSLAIFVLCCLYYIFTQIKNLRILGNNSFTLTPKKHIENLQSFKLLRHKENTRNYVIYTLVLAIGFGLYFVEFFTQVNNFVIYISLGFTIIWFTVCYFYWQKVYIKREEKIFNAMFDDLNRIKNQFE
ncbi:MAG: hypothetical protein EAZ15_07405 [Sphingobacteriales bacterium]|nr:MAG: hypothetical protein EAZ15_07405 [Sphingobacteriales bacterium]